MSKGFSIVVAMDRMRGIGKDGGLPWPKLKGDMKFFRELTTCPDTAAVEKRWGLKADESAESRTWEDVSAMLKFAHPLPKPDALKKNVVVMGRKTWESLPDGFRPLTERHNIVFSRNSDFRLKGIAANREVRFLSGIISGAISFSFEEEKFLPPNQQFPRFVIGGGQVYKDVLPYPTCMSLYVTEIDAEFPCDTFFPETPDFTPVLTSPWVEEGGIRYRFRRYDRVTA